MTPTDEIMAQAQVFASSWALVGSRFDSGDEMDRASGEKACLYGMVEALTKERDELRLQIDIQAGSIEAVQDFNQRLAEERDAWRVVCDFAFEQRDALAAKNKECVRCLGEALQDRADLAAAAKLAIAAMSYTHPNDSNYEDCLASITALRQAGVQ